MKGSFPKPVYILITILGAAILILNTVTGLPIAASAAGAGLLAYGLNRLIGEWRIANNPEYAKKLDISNKDERLAYIADKARSVTLIVTIFVLALSGVILLSINMEPYGFTCFYIADGIAVLYLVVYQIMKRRY